MAGCGPAFGGDGCDLEVSNAARQYLYALFQSIFGAQPSREQVVSLNVSLAKEACLILDLAEVGDFVSDVAAFRDCVARGGKGAARALDTHEDDYMRLFVGMGGMLAPPWESVYVSGQRMTFQKATLAVRSFYRSQGFEPKLLHKTPDDHIALEACFLGMLAQRMGRHAAQGEMRSYDELAKLSKEFIQAHPLRWIGPFSSDVSEGRPGCLYAKAAGALASLLESDCDFLEAAA